jgi:hypothetical protein
LYRFWREKSIENEGCSTSTLVTCQATGELPSKV